MKMLHHIFKVKLNQLGVHEEKFYLSFSLLIKKIILIIKKLNKKNM